MGPHLIELTALFVWLCSQMLGQVAEWSSIESFGILENEEAEDKRR